MLGGNAACPVRRGDDDVRKALVVFPLHEEFDEDDADDDADDRHCRREPHDPRTFRAAGDFMEIFGDVFQRDRRQPREETDEDAAQKDIPLDAEPLPQHFGEPEDAEVRIFQKKLMMKFHCSAPGTGFLRLSRFMVRISLRNSSRF